MIFKANCLKKMLISIQNIEFNQMIKLINIIRHYVIMMMMNYTNCIPRTNVHRGTMV
jgi:hypothetical protein